MEVTHLLGLDLGQVSDPTALCLAERTLLSPLLPAAYAVRGLVRWPLGTPYPQIVSDVLEHLDSPLLRDPVLVVDQTGVGRAVVDLFRLQVRCGFRPVTITSGTSVSRLPSGEIHVPKKDLVGTLQTLLGYRRLQVAASLAEAQVLVKELQNFKIRITKAANEQFLAWRDGEHDDMVLALALALWVGEHALAGPLQPSAHPGNVALTARPPAGVFLSDPSDPYAARED